MSREHRDAADAMRYATEAWRHTREQVINSPVYAVQGIIDKNQPQIAEIVEKGLRRQLLEGIDGVLFDGRHHVIAIARKELNEPLLMQEPNITRVEYRAEITEVEHRHYMVADAWGEYLTCRKSKGRNHRKKDRAVARRKRAERRKLRERLAR